jgi:hypothetical protein
MKKINLYLYLCLITTLILSNAVFPQESNNFSKLELSDRIINIESRLEYNSNLNKVKRIIREEHPDEKSPYLGALFSGLIPGTGEFYAESYIKSAIFFAAEVGLWITYFIFENNGDDQTELYQNFADQNWNVRKYAQWLVDEQFEGSSGINPNNPDLNELRAQINYCEQQNFSHTLPQYGEQQYYEVIGKYQNFMAGWSDAIGITKNNYNTFTTPFFHQYTNDRQKANDYYDNASLTLTGIVVNHVLSAADAAWSVTMFNKELRVETNVSVKNIYSTKNYKYNLTPFANISITF